MDTGQTSASGNGNGQAALWKGDAGHAWVEAQELLDAIFKPIEDMLAQAIPEDSDRQVLDVGCGAGSTSLAAARRLGEKGRCVGIDISEPMIAAATARAAREDLATTFICDDAQRHAFAPASFDLIMSRFGVMFFNDPVAAFTNLRRAACDHAEIQLVVWRSAEENPFMTAAERAAATLLPNMPQRRPDEPGQFGLANPQRMLNILLESGWTEIDIMPVDVACAFPEKDLLAYLTRMGPLGRALQHVEEQTRDRVVQTVRAAFDPYVGGEEVRFTAACWKVSATASGGSSHGEDIKLLRSNTGQPR